MFCETMSDVDLVSDSSSLINTPPSLINESFDTDCKYISISKRRPSGLITTCLENSNQYITPPHENRVLGCDLYCIKFDHQNGVVDDSPLVDELMRVIPSVSNRNRKDIRIAVRCVLKNLVRAQLTSRSYLMYTGFLYRQNTSGNILSKRPLRYVAGGAKMRAVQQVLSALDEREYVARKRGFWNKSSHLRGVSSAWFPTSRFCDFVLGHYRSIDDVPVESLGSTMEVVILKDANGEYMDYSDTSETSAIRNVVMDMNRVNTSARWSCTQQIVPPDYLVCRRIFNHADFRLGGRFYLGLQNVPSKQRPQIRINGRAVCEIDYVSFQPRLLYNLMGHGAPDDCYSVDSLSRNVVKHAFLLAINCKNETSAIREFVANEEYPEIDSHRQAVNVLRAVAESNNLVSDKFYQGMGLTLQYIDACIASEVIQEFVYNNIPILPIHDSFVTVSEHRDMLRNVMLNKYEQQMGFVPVIKEDY